MGRKIIICNIYWQYFNSQCWTCLIMKYSHLTQGWWNFSVSQLWIINSKIPFKIILKDNNTFLLIVISENLRLHQYPMQIIMFVTLLAPACLSANGLNGFWWKWFFFDLQQWSNLSSMHIIKQRNWWNNESNISHVKTVTCHPIWINWSYEAINLEKAINLFHIFD